MLINMSEFLVDSLEGCLTGKFVELVQGEGRETLLLLLELLMEVFLTGGMGTKATNSISHIAFIDGNTFSGGTSFESFRVAALGEFL